jgi:hypothetical protein
MRLFFHFGFQLCTFFIPYSPAGKGFLCFIPTILSLLCFLYNLDAFYNINISPNATDLVLVRTVNDYMMTYLAVDLFRNFYLYGVKIRPDILIHHIICETAYLYYDNFGMACIAMAEIISIWPMIFDQKDLRLNYYRKLSIYPIRFFLWVNAIHAFLYLQTPMIQTLVIPSTMLCLDFYWYLKMV